mmetsp:Transcript_53333/g.84796  ORF Transcript_53333/g.84796 Transcript_53333/m.84796 type:complete len:131 (+) Transcript_53333:320-712(+)
MVRMRVPSVRLEPRSLLEKLELKEGAEIKLARSEDLVREADERPILRTQAVGSDRELQQSRLLARHRDEMLHAAGARIDTKGIEALRQLLSKSQTLRSARLHETVGRSAQHPKEKRPKDIRADEDGDVMK